MAAATRDDVLALVATTTATMTTRVTSLTAALLDSSDPVGPRLDKSIVDAIKVLIAADVVTADAAAAVLLAQA